MFVRGIDMSFFLKKLKFTFNWLSNNHPMQCNPVILSDYNYMSLQVVTPVRRYLIMYFIEFATAPFRAVPKNSIVTFASPVDE